MDRRDQEARRELTDGAAHLLASTLLNQLGLSCFVRSFLAFLGFSFVPMAPKRARPVASVEEIDGRDEAPDEDEQALVSDGERTVSDIPVPIEIEGIVAESSAQRTKDFPQEVSYRRAGLLLKTTARCWGTRAGGGRERPIGAYFSCVPVCLCARFFFFGGDCVPKFGVNYARPHVC